METIKEQEQNGTTPDNVILTKVEDVDMLKYLIKESGKTKEEIEDEIKDRFWSQQGFIDFINKPA
jgi:CRISPR/Cas system-associated protein Cas10 (large subunit of type III CRISPR-Cas system)